MAGVRLSAMAHRMHATEQHATGVGTRYGPQVRTLAAARSVCSHRRAVSASAKLIPAFVAGIVLAWALTSCGSGGSGTVAQQVKSATPTATGKGTGGTQTPPPPPP